MPLDISRIVLGILYLYERRVIFHGFENKYHFFKNGVEYIVRAHRKNLSLSLASVGEMKRPVYSSKNFVLLTIMQKNDMK